MIFLETNAFADSSQQTSAKSLVGSAGTPAMTPMPQRSMLLDVAPFIAMAAIFYFLMIRPQQKKLKEHDQMVNSLQKGEEVITRSGIIGKIHGIADKFITLEVDHNVRLKIVKNQIEMVLRGEQKV
jgi:preprotein translocase subunit YajC